tara:strand:- start:53 stop:304 length:252 start_codon:yes stop_codon:yes gene_type:complete
MNSLINEFDEIVRWPKKPSDKEIVINWLSNKFYFDKKYSEKEINEILDCHHSFNDIPLLRRELISRKYLNRTDDGSTYWKIDK